MTDQIEKFRGLVRSVYDQFDASHDWQHIERVWNNAQIILEDEPEADRFTVEIAVLLHDVSDPKYAGQDGKSKEKELLLKLGLTEEEKKKSSKL
ncbi:HD domain-containing protein [Chungangia koreensis]|uniref:HD domain-containing protein n=1 Tax=Chungangia koreensis TaxID=752657 RepID=A0ABV8X8G0_9LACT